MSDNAREIKKALLDKGITQSMLAAELGVSRATISLVISEKDKSKRVYEYIKKRLGLAISTSLFVIK